MSTGQRTRPFEMYETRVESIDNLSPRNVNVRFQLPQGKEKYFKAGQFVQIFVPREGDKPRRTAYSIASPPQLTDSFELCVTRVDGGVSSGYVHQLKKGDKVTVLGPLGRFTLPDNLPRDVVFIATGSGIAPFRSMVNDLLYKETDKNVYLLYGNRHDDDILYQKEWEKLASTEKNFKLYLTLSQPKNWTGPKGYVGSKIEEFIPNLKEKDYYICGLSTMIDSVKDKLRELEVPDSQIHFEKYD
ncbi:hypothetical protein BVX98_03665 [bacterium F11]|nr:hypothetical protein BVX98_03665 [bacterium F11]